MKEAVDGSQVEGNEVGSQGEDGMPDEKEAAEIMAEMKMSNLGDIIRNMTVHEQLKMLRHIIE